MPVKRLDPDNAELVIGLERIDSQHRILISAVNRVMEGTGQDRVSRLEELRLLLTWARYHFAAEEEMLVRVGYPQLPHHHGEHERFLTILAAFNRDYHAGKRNIDEPLTDFLSSWTLHHIKNEDTAYTRLMGEQGISPDKGEASGRRCPPFVDAAEVRNATGVPVIDRQHEEMVNLLNWVRCYSAAEHHKRPWLANRIRVLYFYTRYHFLYEEILQRRGGFPLAADHRLQHEELLARARDFITEFSRGREELTEGILNFFKAWTLQHILVEDTRMRGMAATALPDG